MRADTQRWIGSAIAVAVVCAGAYFGSSRGPEPSTRDRLVAEAKARLGLTQVWLEQPGRNFFRGRGIDAAGGDYDLVFNEQGSSRAWSFMAKDRRTGQERRADIRW